MGIIFSLKNIHKKVHKPEAILNKPMSIMADYATWLIANYTNLTPNIVTVISLVFMLAGAVFFAKKMFIIGVVLIIIRNVLDEVDGRLARVKKMGTKIGPYLDNGSAYIGTFAVIVALLYTQERNLIMLMVPILTIMFFLFPLQSSLVKLLVKKVRPRNYKNLLEFEDSRIAGVLIIPLVYTFIPDFNFTNNMFLIYTAGLIFIQQVLWLKHYYKDFKTS